MFEGDLLSELVRMGYCHSVQIKLIFLFKLNVFLNRIFRDILFHGYFQGSVRWPAKLFPDCSLVAGLLLLE